MRECANWRIKLFDSTQKITPYAVATADGVITEAPLPQPVADVLRQRPLPVVLTHNTSYHPCDLPVECLRLDDDAIGAAAFWYFSRLGNFASFAVIADLVDHRWTKAREWGFCRAAKENFTAEVVAKEKEGTATVTAKVLPKGSSIKKEITCKITVAKDKEAASSTGATGTMVIETGNWGKLNLRAEKNRKSQSLGLYPSGTVVNVTANDGTWARVTVGGKTGITPDLPINSYAVAPGTKLHVKGTSFAYLRSSTSTADNSNVIAKMPGGSEVTMVKWGKWYSQVQYGGKVGYVVTTHLRK